MDKEKLILTVKKNHAIVVLFTTSIVLVLAGFFGLTISKEDTQKAVDIVITQIEKTVEEKQNECFENQKMPDGTIAKNEEECKNIK